MSEPSLCFHTHRECVDYVAKIYICKECGTTINQMSGIETEARQKADADRRSRRAIIRFTEGFFQGFLKIKRSHIPKRIECNAPQDLEILSMKVEKSAFDLDELHILVCSKEFEVSDGQPSIPFLEVQFTEFME